MIWIGTKSTNIHGKQHDLGVSNVTILRHFQHINGKLFRAHQTRLILVQ